MVRYFLAVFLVFYSMSSFSEWYLSNGYERLPQCAAKGVPFKSVWAYSDYYRCTYWSGSEDPCNGDGVWNQSIQSCSAPSVCDSAGLFCDPDLQPDNDNDCKNTNSILENPACAGEKSECEASGGFFGFVNGQKICASSEPSTGGCSSGDVIITNGDNQTANCVPPPSEASEGGNSPLGGSYEPDSDGGYAGAGGSGDNHGGNTPTDLDGRYVCPDGSRPLFGNRCLPSSENGCYGADCPAPDICSDGYPPQWTGSFKSCDRSSPTEFCPDGTPVWSLSVCPQSVSTDPDSPDYDSRADPFADDYDPNFMPDNQPPPATVENPVEVDSQGAEESTGLCNPESKGYLQCISQTSATIERGDKGLFDDLSPEIEAAQADFEEAYTRISSEVSDLFDFDIGGASSTIESNFKEIKGVQVDFSIVRFLPSLSIIGNVIFAVFCFMAAVVVLSGGRS